MTMQVHIHPIVTPTSTTNSSPVADPSIASLVVLVLLRGVVVSIVAAGEHVGVSGIAVVVLSSQLSV